MKATRDSDSSIHPGPYVRRQVLPEGMTVTKAAEILGIGRVALTNFLNGKSALSKKMAARLEDGFGANSEELLELQAQFDRQEADTDRGAHAPTLAVIKAADIHRWADTIEARQELAALLRRLVCSTGRNLIHVDFPAYDNAERHGWDGVVEAEIPTPRIPTGKSGWEFGCNRNPQAKAEKDYTDRSKSIGLTEKRETTFIFVTPRNWRNKRQWAAAKAKLGDWKEVRAFDADDLEQWLEHSAAIQIWIAERLGAPVEGFRSLDRCWSMWAGACTPELPPTLFDTAVEEASKTFAKWISEPPERPFIVSADSSEEALAFLSCLCERLEAEFASLNSGAIVFDEPEAIRRFDKFFAVPRIAIVHRREVEREIGDLCRRCHCVIVRPVNDVSSDPDTRLGLLGHEDFSAVLKRMKLSKDRIDMLTRESGRSRTVLRRRLSHVPAVQRPSWTGDQATARRLLPAALVGAWHDASPADQEVVRLLAQTNVQGAVENDLAELQARNDSPVWSTGEYRGVVSRIDTLFSIAEFITKSDLENFFFVAEFVLSESDPALDLTDEEQWKAPVYGKVREHSAALRSGIRETLVLLAVFGGKLFPLNSDMALTTRICRLVTKLLNNLNSIKIRNHNSDLPDYAEAAPEEFLSIIEGDLRQPNPIVGDLFRPAILPFESPLRSHLLWALELLAWNPQTFPRVVQILAILCKLNKREPADNWTNKPENTLYSLFRSWMPQTSASVTDRIRVFEKLCKDHPNLSWPICMGHLDQGPDHAMDNLRPRWRDDVKSTAGRLIEQEHFDFTDKCTDLAFDWPRYSQATLGDLVDRLENFTEPEQLKVWNLVEQWISQEPPDYAKAELRKRIIGCAHVRWLRKESIFQPERERKALSNLLSNDPIVRNAWLFESSWIELPPEDSEEDFDDDRNEQRVAEKRRAGIQEVWDDSGFEGVQALLEKSQTADLVGALMAAVLEGSYDTKLNFVKLCIQASLSGNVVRYRSCLSGFIRSTEPEFLDTLFGDLERSGRRADLLTLFLALPFQGDTWSRFSNGAESFREEYWSSVEPRVFLRHDQEDDINESIDRLLSVERADAAFQAVHLVWRKVETSRLVGLLDALVDRDLVNEVGTPNLRHYISEAFDSLEERQALRAEEKARLEFGFLPWLDRSKHGIPNLERSLAETPEMYAEAIAGAFKRVDGEDDPQELRIEDDDRRKTLAMMFRRLLGRLRRIPGSDDSGNIDPSALKSWISRVRDLSARYGRTESADYMMGELLSHAPAGGDGIWPSRPVCEAMEWFASERLARGFEIGTLNNRGVHWRGEGGDQERELAERYRRWANELRGDYPYAAGLLDRIANSYDYDAGHQDTESQVRQRLSTL